MKHIGKLWALAFFGIGLALVWQVAQDGEFAPIKKSSPKTTESPNEEMPIPPAIEDPEFAEKPMIRVAKTPSELRKEIDGVCKNLKDKLVSQNLSNRAASINFNFHEKKHAEMLFSQMIKGCFAEDKKSDFKFEIDVFSSEFAGRAQDQIQLQVSAFDFKSNNKIFETGVQFELSVPAPEDK